jgi:A/G-specific adenine glycosylase
MTDFHLLITEWYRQNARDLPWRNTKDPYFIWLSEIILQQTRVDQGINYYFKFIQNYPTVFDLANADEQQVLKDWQGLGYYSRARNLHATAKLISTDYNGIFPTDHKAIRSLKGIGDYTAAAIGSFAFNLPHAVVDGNVYRVLSRYFDIEIPIDSTDGKKHFQELAQEILNINDPAIHNQAIMELGALVCKPTQPNCTACPLRNGCLALKNNTTLERPIKEKKTKVRNRYFSFLIFRQDYSILMKRRTEKDVWQHLYQFPLIETQTKSEDLSHLKHLKMEPVRVSNGITHILSHQRIHAVFYHYNQFPSEISPDWEIFQEIQLSDLPLPRLIDRYLEENPMI